MLIFDIFTKYLAVRREKEAQYLKLTNMFAPGHWVRNVETNSDFLVVDVDLDAAFLRTPTGCLQLLSWARDSELADIENSWILVPGPASN